MLIKEVVARLSAFSKGGKKIVSSLALRDIVQSMAFSVFAGLASLAIIGISLSVPLGLAIGGAVTALGTVLGALVANRRLHHKSLLEVATALLRATDLLPKDVRVKEINVAYDLGDDTTEIRYQLQNKDTNPLAFWPLFWNQIENVRIQTADATVVGAGKVAGSQMVRILILPQGMEVRSSHYQVLALFMPPIRPDETVLLKIRLLRPSLWKPLRKTGRDSGKYTIKQSCSELTIDLVFPRGWDGKISPTTPRKGRVVSRINCEGRLEVRWILDSVAPYTTLEYAVSAKKGNPSTSFI